MDNTTARDLINDQQPTFLERAKKSGYICPSCHSGSGPKGTGLSFEKQAKKYKCFGGCGFYGDVIDLWGIAHGTPGNSNYIVNLQGAAEYYGITIDQQNGSGTARTQNFNRDSMIQDDGRKQEPAEDLTAFYEAAAADLEKTDYWQRRGLSLETCKRFKLGYVESWKHPKSPRDAASPRLIIPVTTHKYIARYTGQGHFLKADGSTGDKLKVKTGSGGLWLYNPKALEQDEKPVFVVEGELDALSIIEVGGEAVALGSTAFRNDLIKKLQKLGSMKQPLILLLDNDKAGQEAQAAIIKGIEDSGLKILVYSDDENDILGGYKDANERLQQDRAGLEAAIARAYKEAAEQQEADTEEQAEAQEKARQEYLAKNCAANYLNEFLGSIDPAVNTPAIPTGFKALDAALDGGLYEGLYVIGAITSLGKTTFILQAADQIAASGQDVLIFALEMSRRSLIARSVSRNTAILAVENGLRMNNAKTSRGITCGDRYKDYSETELNLIKAAVNKYASYAEHLFIFEGLMDMSIEKIRGIVEEHIQATGNTPAVIVDYLQIMEPVNIRDTEKQATDRNVKGLKLMSRDLKIPVVAVSSVNRANYNTPISLAAMKESGGIEYGCDVILGLQLQGAGKTEFNADKEKSRTTADGTPERKLELVILKQREGQTGGSLYFNYYPHLNYFMERENAED